MRHSSEVLTKYKAGLKDRAMLQHSPTLHFRKQPSLFPLTHRTQTCVCLVTRSQVPGSHLVGAVALNSASSLLPIVHGQRGAT